MTHPPASQYTPTLRKACHSVLIELIHILSDFVDDIAIVGGWVPELLIPNAVEEHIGTIDIDLALNPINISKNVYSTINKLLTKHNYKQNDKDNAQFKYFKTVKINGDAYTIEVDLLTGEYLGQTGRNRRHETIQDVKPLKARGVDLVFNRTETVRISGDLPNNGGKDTVICKIAGIVPFIVMKGIVLKNRRKEKDAYDIEYVLRNYRADATGIGAIAELMAPDLDHATVKEALSNIENAFLSPDHYGPTDIITFLEIDDEAEQAIRKRSAYETVQNFLNTLQSKNKK